MSGRPGWTALVAAVVTLGCHRTQANAPLPCEVAAASPEAAPVFVDLPAAAYTRQRDVVAPTPDTLPQSPVRLVLNVPAYRLDVFAHDTLARRYTVAVGMNRYRTPRGTFAVTRIVWHPWWIPPESEWAKDDTVTPPGEGNPMGRVKLYFRPLLFLHGTPLERSLGSAASHGCVRMDNDDVVALAKLVQRAGMPSLPEDSAETWLQGMRTIQVDLEIPVPIDVRYDLVEVRDGVLYAYPDVYWLHGGVTSAAVLASLAEAGVDSAWVDRDRLAQFARSARRRARQLPVDSLLIEP